MTINVTPTQDGTLTILKAFLDGIVRSGTSVIDGQDNRVPEPSNTDFVVMTPTRRRRLATNVDDFVDVRFIASIAGTVMTVTTVDFGTLEVGSVIFGVDVTTGTKITALGTGTGGVGTYSVTPSQVITSEVMAAGVWNVLQPTELTFQLDVHGPNSSENSQTISTLFRSDYAAQIFKDADPTTQPLYADDPRQLPFINGEQQYENRWSIDVMIQANETVNDIPQQFADSVLVGLIDVDAVYPPT